MSNQRSRRGGQGLAWFALMVLALPAGAQQRERTTQPYIAYCFPAGGQQGTTVDVALSGSSFEAVNDVRCTPSHVAVKLNKVLNGRAAQMTATISPKAPPGEYEIRLLSPTGASNRIRFFVSQLPEVLSKRPTDDREHAQKLDSLPVVVNGQVMEGHRDYYKFRARQGEDLVCAVQARAIIPYMADAVPGWLDAVLTLFDSNGREVAAVDDSRLEPDPVLIYKVPADGDYYLEIHDVLFRGRGDFVYRLSLGALPRIVSIFPLGGQRKSVAHVALTGVNLPAATTDLELTANGPSERKIRLSSSGLDSNDVPFAVGEYPEAMDQGQNETWEKSQHVTLPVTINGRIDRPGAVHWYTFGAEKGQKLVMEVFARRLTSPLDSLLTLCDNKGRRIAENDDYLDLSLPLLTRQGDSRILYTFNQSATYCLKVRDVQGMGGPDYAYRLTIAPPRPDFLLRITPDNPRIARGDTAVFTVLASRRDGYDGEISLSVTDLPPGFTGGTATIPANADRAVLTMTAPKDAADAVFSPTVVGIGQSGNTSITHIAGGAEQVMQSFFYMFFPNTREVAFTIIKGGVYGLELGKPPEGPVEVEQGGTTDIPLKINRDKGVRNWLYVYTAQPAPAGVSFKGMPVPGDKSEVMLTISAAKTVPVGKIVDLVVTSTCRLGPDVLFRSLPAFQVKVIEAKPVVEDPNVKPTSN